MQPISPQSPSSMTPARRGRPGLEIAGGIAIVAVWALVNLAMYPFLDRASWSLVPLRVMVAAGILLGIIASQIGALSAALVFGGRGFLLRLIGMWGVGLFLFACWAAGVLYTDGLRGHRSWPWELFGDVGLALPLISLAIQAPLWMLKLHFGWRIELPAESLPAGRRQPYSIRDILLGTLVTALSITAVRFVVDSRQDLDEGFWAVWGIGAAFFAGASLLVLVPLLALTLRINRPAVAFGSAAAYAVTAGILAALLWIAWHPRILKDTDFPMLVTMLITCPLALLAPLGLARLAGYRLQPG
jgi:hypothetical protein